MLKLFPPSSELVDLDELYQEPLRPDPGNRPWVALNMVVSLDGATALQGRSAGLGGPADRTAFHALRAAADVVMAGAGTLRAESYGPPRTKPADQQRRLARGQPAFPRLATVSGSLQLDVERPFFTNTPTRPLVITNGRAQPARRELLAEVADVIVAGDEAVDLPEAFAELRRRDLRFVLVEGGPWLNGLLAEADLVDELNLTVSPLLAGGATRSLLGGAVLPAVQRLELVHAVEEDGMLLLRYCRS
jgi:riboflavin biosynthesis pyrimidine reductase